MSKAKELIICLTMVIILILTIVNNVFAVDAESVLGNNNTSNNVTANNTVNNNTNSVNNVNTNSNISQIQQIPSNTTANTTTNTTTNNNANTNNNNATTMPNTGVDYSVVAIIAVCGISAIYAYKKIRDYNNF